MPRHITWRKTRDLFQSFPTPFVLTGSWFYPHSFLGNGLKRLVAGGVWSPFAVWWAVLLWAVFLWGYRGPGSWCPSGMASRWAPTPNCLFLVPQRFLHYRWPLCSAHSTHPSCHPLPFKIMCFILARSLLPLVLNVTCKKGIPEPALKLPGLFPPSTAFLSSISVWCAFASYPSWKWKKVNPITKKGVTLGCDPLYPERTLGLL